jgi:hypothetical protein
MHKPLRIWDKDFISSLEATEQTDFEIKSSGALENLRRNVGKTVSAFANYDGGHIILGARESPGTIEADGQLAAKRDINSLKDWLEDTVRTLTDPPLSDFDVRIFETPAGPLAAIEVRPSEHAPHQNAENKIFYARSGSHCYPLGVSQIKDIWQRQKKPILQVMEFKIGPGEGRYPFLLTVKLHNISNTVCRSHLVRTRVPLLINTTPVILPEPSETYQPKDFGYTHSYLDKEAEFVAHVVEFQGGEIYPDHDVTKLVRFYKPAGLELNQFLSRTAREASLKVFTDPSSEIRGPTLAEANRLTIGQIKN